MKSAGTLIIAVTLLFSAAARAQDDAASAATVSTSTASDSPYASIVSRNMFGLVPIPPPPDPAANQPPPDPPPKITPNGIMTIFGKLQALFKVADKGKPGQPPKDKSYVLTEGERQDDIEVVKINKADGIITFNNHGTVQELPLVAAKEASSAPGPGGTLGGPPGAGAAGGYPGMRPSSAMSPSERAAAMRRQPGRMGGPPADSGNNTGDQNFNGGGGGVSNPAQNQTANLSPEAKVLLIEAQRMQYMQEGNPIANLLPPTPLTQQNVNEGPGLPAMPTGRLPLPAPPGPPAP